MSKQDDVSRQRAARQTGHNQGRLAQSHAATPVFLLTGFEPFGGDRVNPSWEIARRLDGREVGGGAEGTARAVVRSVLLPCVFHKALDVLDDALADHRPVAVIGLGLAASRHDISIERVAINIDDARIPDNAGRQPIDEPIIPDSPAAYWSTLPIKSILAALQQAHVPASISQSAGTFVCNHVFYGLAHRLAVAHRERAGRGAPQESATSSRMPESLPVRGGFIHVPWPAAEAGSTMPGHSTMDLETMIRAIEIAIRVTLAVPGADVRLAGGAID
jgi:pyroglutamyl-peptidase